jgi:hypothetical protein
MQLSRRMFITGLTAVLVRPRLALPVPSANMKDEVEDFVVAFHESVDNSVVGVRLRVVLVGRFAQQALARDPHLWSAVMVNRRLT